MEEEKKQEEEKVEEEQKVDEEELKQSACVREKKYYANPEV